PHDIDGMLVSYMIDLHESSNVQRGNIGINIRSWNVDQIMEYNYRIETKILRLKKKYLKLKSLRFGLNLQHLFMRCKY
ncbi:hypothetical protein, partial [Ferroplasma acidiphilum]|uniref:hypothetical protein n=1 Tax=Ferroplasma acidiphilum TaxID=74969 RepID=UPI001F441497